MYPKSIIEWIFMLTQVLDFCSVKLTPALKKELTPLMISWRTVHTSIRDMDDSTENLDQLARMLAFEAQSDEPRVQLVTRLHGRLNAMRQRMEFNTAIANAKAEKEPKRRRRRQTSSSTAAATPEKGKRGKKVSVKRSPSLAPSSNGAASDATLAA